MSSFDVIVVGGGHNGLVAAAYLAKAGKKVLVLERRHLVGGAAVTEEVFPGFKFTVCSYVLSLMRPEVIHELDLPSHGLQVIPQEALFFPLPSGSMPNGDYLLLRGNDHAAHNEIARFSKRDAEAYVPFGQVMTRMAQIITPLLNVTPPDLASASPSELRKLLRLSRHFGKVSEEDLYGFAQIMTMSAAEYLDGWFETDVLKAAIAANGIIGTMLGPYSPGSAYVLMHHFMGEVDGAYHAWGYARGGMGAVSESIAAAARGYGAEIRTNADVRRILVRNGRSTGVELADGSTIRSRTVLSNADPKRTFLQLVEPSELPQDFVAHIKNFRIDGSSGKVNLALSRLPEFSCLPGDGAHLRGLIDVCPSLEYMERAYEDAKYGGFSRKPYIDICIPTTMDTSLAPPGKHVVSMFVQYAPYHLRNGTWDEQREAFGDAVIDTVEEYAPTLSRTILHRQVLSPLDLERIYGLTGGNIFHGELTQEQLFLLRPVPGWARYRTPIKGLYLCGSGAHPGGGVMGAPGRNAAREVLNDWKLRRL